MKTNFVLLTLALSVISGRAATTIDGASKYAYGANVGWMDWTGDTTDGAVIGAYVCSGYIYSANIGWINLGSGSPANSIQYQNNSATDFGVNNDGSGNLRGYAYSANAGWINFESTGAPAVNQLTGVFTGNVWSANCGWISLSNAVAYMKTDSISPGALDSNGLPIAWELANFGMTGINPNADPDHDGMSNLEEYLAGTNPNDATSNLKITGYNFASQGTSALLTWNSVLSRYYYIQETLNVSAPSWVDSGLGLISPDGNSTTRTLSNASATNRFYRVQAYRPLTQ